MPTDRYSAIDEILRLFKAGWVEYSATVLGLSEPPHVEYPGVDQGWAQDGSAWWARISIQTVGTEQGSFCENVVASGAKRYTTYGLGYVQLFAPKSNTAFVKMNRLSNAVQSFFRSRTPNVTFRNIRVVELASENGCLRSNVVFEFEFDELQDSLNITVDFDSINEGGF